MSPGLRFVLLLCGAILFLQMALTGSFRLGRAAHDVWPLPKWMRLLVLIIGGCFAGLLAQFIFRTYW